MRPSSIFRHLRKHSLTLFMILTLILGIAVPLSAPTIAYGAKEKTLYYDKLDSDQKKLYRELQEIVSYKNHEITWEYNKGEVPETRL